MAKAAKGIVIIALIVAAVTGLILLRGFVLAELWGWFIAPLGIPAIGIAHAIGVSLVASLFLIGLAQDKPSDDQEGWWKVVHLFAKGVGACLFSWGLGAIVHGFM